MQIYHQYRDRGVQKVLFYQEFRKVLFQKHRHQLLESIRLMYEVEPSIVLVLSIASLFVIKIKYKLYEGSRAYVAGPNQTQCIIYRQFIEIYRRQNKIYRVLLWLEKPCPSSLNTEAGKTKRGWAQNVPHTYRNS